jgi:hypothetical protein
VRGLDHHQDGNSQYQAFQDVIDTNHPVGHGGHQRVYHPLDDQPGGEKIQTLKCVKAHNSIVAKLAGSQNNNSSDPADGGNVAED